MKWLFSYGIKILFSITVYNRLKIQYGSLNCDSAKVLYSLKCDDAAYIEKEKTKFHYRSNNSKSKYKVLRKG